MKFRKGESGNPKGRPKGALNAIRAAMRQRLTENAESLFNAGLELALAGDVRMLAFFLDRIIPAIEDSDGAQDKSIKVVFLPKREESEE